MSKLKICHIVSGLKAGGVESMIYNYCSHMDSKKLEFHILYQHEPSIKNVEEFVKLGFKLHRISSKVKHPIRNYIETRKYLKDNNIDVVHCHMTLMNFIPLIAAKNLKIKTRICHSHNSDVRKKNVFVKVIEYILKKICILTATDLVACGDDAGKFMYGNKDFVVLNNALDLDKFKYNEIKRQELRKKYGIKENEIVIGHIGRFTNQKNHEFIVELFKLLSTKNSKYKLMLVGDGELKNKIENLVDDYELADKVCFTGIISNTNEIYSAFDLFILPSLWEGLPVVGIESQVSGLNCFFSSNIDKNVCIVNDRVMLLSLNINKWVKVICNFDNNYNRNIILDIFDKKKLNIKIEVNILQQMYLE